MTLICRYSLVCKVLQKLVHSYGVSVLDSIWQKLRSYAEMCKIFIAWKSYCACCARIKYCCNFIVHRTTSGRELFDDPSYDVDK